MDYVIYRYISSNRKEIRRQTHRVKRQQYDKVAANSAFHLLDITRSL